MQDLSFGQSKLVVHSSFGTKPATKPLLPNPRSNIIDDYTFVTFHKRIPNESRRTSTHRLVILWVTKSCYSTWTSHRTGIHASSVQTSFRKCTIVMALTAFFNICENEKFINISRRSWNRVLVSVAVMG